MKKAFAVIALLLVGLLLFGCTGSGQQPSAQPTAQPTGTQQAQSTLQATASEQPKGGEFKPLNPTGTYCDFRVDSLTPEKIKAAGFQGEINYAKRTVPLSSNDFDLSRQSYYYDENNEILIVADGVCNIDYKLKQGNNTFFVNIKNYLKDSTAKAFIDGDATLGLGGAKNMTGYITTDEFGQGSVETVLLSGFSIMFYQGSFIATVTTTVKDGLFKDSPDAETLKANAKVIARLIDENLK